jgi:hypothetical protein
MAPVAPVQPVKRFVAMLWSDPGRRENATERLLDAWGAIDHAGADHPFDLTDYYRAEMGAGLQRRLLAFEVLMPPDSLAETKLQCNAWERELAEAGRRTINLDVGYLDHNKIVLASMK